MKIIKTITVDLSERRVMAPIHAVQCDANTRAVAVTLTAGGVAWEPPADATVSVAFKKPDGKKGWYDKLPDGSPACSVSGNAVTAILAPEVLTAAGKVDAVIVFQDKNLNQLATFGFAILVEPNPAAGRGISNDYYAYSTMADVNQAMDAFFAKAEAEQAAFTEKVEADQAAFLEAAGEVLAAVHEAVSADAPAIVCEASGDVIAVADSSDRLVQGLKIFGKTVQNGTPSPDAPVELVSVGDSGSVGLTVAGKNLFDPAAVTVDAILEDDGSVTTSASGNGVVTDFIPVLPGESYSISPTSLHRGKYFDAHKLPLTAVQDFSPASGITIIPPTDARYIRMAVYLNAVGGVLQVEKGTQTTAYEPYKAQALTVSTPNGLPGIPVASGGNYTDASGQQWICDEVDPARGVYVQRIGRKSRDEISWAFNTNAGEYAAFTATVNDAVYLSANNDGTRRCLCNILHGEPGSQRLTPNTISMISNKRLYVYLPYSAFGGSGDKSASDNANLVNAWWKSKDNVTILYQLDAPIETPLSAEEIAAFKALHSNKPNTTAQNDAGAHMELSYVADTKLYIDQKFTELATALVNKT